MNDYWVYLLATLLIEFFVALPLSLTLESKKRMGFIAAILGANLISHPIAFVVYVGVFPQLFSVEFGVCVFEATIIGFVLQMRWLNATVVSVILNIVSMFVGGWLL